MAVFQGSLQIQNNLSEIASNGTQTEALTNLGAVSPAQLQNCTFNYSTEVTYALGASGTMYTATYNPPITEYVDGMILSFMSPYTNLGPAYFNAGAGSIAVLGRAYAALQGYELNANAMVLLQYSAYYNSWIVISGQQLQVGAARYNEQAPQWGQVLAGNNAMWNNVRTDRALTTTYTNTQGKPIVVSVLVLDDATANVVLAGAVNGVGVAYSTGTVANYYIGLNYTVPSGATYEVTTSSGTATLQTWMELY